MFWNAFPRIVQLLFLSIAVDQQNHKSFRITVHSSNFVFFEPVQNMEPTARHRKHLHPPIPVNLKMEAVCYIAVGIIFRKYQDVWVKLVGAHGSTSPRISALIISPVNWIWLSGRTIVGSRWLFLYRKSVFSLEKRRIASGLCDVAMN